MNQASFYIGQELPNGAVIIAARPDGRPSGNGRLECSIVLALKSGLDSAGDHDPYVTWVANKQNGTFNGNYFSNFNEAAHDFATR